MLISIFLLNNLQQRLVSSMYAEKIKLIPDKAGHINKFFGEHRFLSNFHEFPVKFDGLTYPSTENAYQAAKTLNPAERLKFTTMTPAESKKAGRAISANPSLSRADWHQFSLKVMEEVCTYKFSQDPFCREGLYNTVNSIIEEGNWWHDNFYGRCYCGGNLAANCPGDGSGKNHLGNILMVVRFKLQSGLL